MLDKMDKEVVDREWLTQVEELVQAVNHFINKGVSTDKDNMEWKIEFTCFERDKLNQLVKNVMLP